MPTEVYEDSIDLEIGLIEAENLRPDGGEAHRDSYPYPLLFPVPGRYVGRTFNTVALENAFIRATFVPALGGRLLRLFDKILNREILLAPDKLTPEVGGPRGAILKAGIQVVTAAADRHGSLAETPFMLDPPSEDEAIGVWFFGLGGDGSFHAHWTLEPEGQILRLSVRAFNRSFRPVGYNGGIIADLGDAELRPVDQGVIWLGGLLFAWDDLPFDFADIENGRLRLLRNGSQPYLLGARQVLNWSLTISPTLSEAIAATANASMTFTDDLKVSTTRPHSDTKLLLETQGGRTLELAAPLSPSEPLSIPRADLPSDACQIAVMDASRNVLIRAKLGDFAPSVKVIDADLPKDEVQLALRQNPRIPFDLRDASAEALARVPAHADFRAAGYIVRAMRLMKAREFAQAADELESSLLFNAEDPLAWWLRAVALRRGESGIDFQSMNPTGFQPVDSGEQRPDALATHRLEADATELLNAHFLAPLEPALRAESFLSQPTQPGREPAAILKPFADQPEAFLEVACLLLDAGLMEDAQRWIDEALRHSDLPLLRYLLADAYLESSRMHVEAAQQVAQAGKTPVGPPYPWRRMEVRAVRSLAEAFPPDANLTEFVALLDTLT